MRYVLVVFMSLFIIGCSNNKPQIANFSDLNLPEIINYDGDKFSKKYQTKDMTEYYLEGEKDYEWSKLITILYAPGLNFKDIDVYINAINKSLYNEQKVSKILYTITKKDEKTSILKTLYYPQNNPNFNKFEMDFEKASIKNCGLIVVKFAIRKNKDSNDKELLEFINKNGDKIIENLPNIECI